ncbi:MAG TPA: glycoside hydrolase family 127 protein [Opitutaceae bacterium]|nr:glycoside hydrolase family 127 protein [Opitutaceae bacterium]
MRHALVFALLLVSVAGARAADYPVQPVPFTNVHLTGGFWSERQEVNRTVTIPFALKQCEESNRLKNFDLAAETLRRRAAGEAHFQNMPLTIFPFDDTDAYKSIEAASYSLSMHPDAALSAKLDGWIARIAAAQEPDGYLYTFRTMHPDSPAHKWVGQKRWENDPILSHELYCCGHLYEAAVAHYDATGKRTLLDVAIRNANLLWRDFGDRKLRIAPGHQIVEMGLVKLYRVTGDQRYLTLARIFLDNRGPAYPGDTQGNARLQDLMYNQRQLPVVDQTEAVGHAVRANYMYSGMADVAALTGDQRYFNAITKIWDNVAGKKLYLTGGVGAVSKWEGYGKDYELPNDGYNETCAAVALMMWNHRMFLMTGDAKYMDVFERTAYNGFISGVSESGDRFFYPNPLEYDGEKKNNSGHAGRVPWFGCACCPPNLMRTLASLTGYFYAVRGDSLYVNLYADSEGEVKLGNATVKLTQTTNYPWDGAVHLVVTPATARTFTLRLRIPEWAQGRPVPTDLYTYENAAATPAWEVTVAGRKVEAAMDHGYVAITREWQPGDAVDLELPMVPHRVEGNAHIAATKGRVAFERGPLVYCVEDVDRALHLGSLSVPITAQVRAEARPKLLGGVTVLTLDGAVSEGRRVGPITAIPYFAWDNRGLAPMEVWLNQGPGVPAL